MMVSYLCAWLGVKLLVLNVHGGTVESDILGITDTFAVRISGVYSGVFASAEAVLYAGEASEVSSVS